MESNATTNILDDGFDDLRRILRDPKCRKYASYFNFHDPQNREVSKRVKEKGVVETLLEAMQNNGEERYHSVKIWKTDPPDCIALDENNEIVAVEVVELVDEKCVKLNQCGKEVYRQWDFESVAWSISKLIKEKDAKIPLKDFKRVILIIHTDEPDIDPQDYISTLECHQFDKTNVIDEIYLLFRYAPETQIYPYLKLCFKQ